MKDKTKKLLIGSNNRVSTNLTVWNNTILEACPFDFPHRLKWDSLDEIYRTDGLLACRYLVNTVGMVTCYFPAKMEISAYDDRATSLDVTIIGPKYIGVNQQGMCDHSTINGKWPLGFVRVSAAQ